MHPDQLSLLSSSNATEHPMIAVWHRSKIPLLRTSYGCCWFVTLDLFPKIFFMSVDLAAKIRVA